MVVINAVEVAEDAQRWTVEAATNDFFRDVHGICTTDASLQELMRNFLGDDHRYLLSAQELLECYYRAVRVIRIPVKSADTYNLINSQLVLLRQEIYQICETAHYEKRIKRRLSGVDDLQVYLHAGFDYFANDIDQPFNFRTVYTSQQTHRS